jgi:hypothetical protein
MGACSSFTTTPLERIDNTSCACSTPVGMKVLRASVIASARRARGNLTVLVTLRLQQEQIASLRSQ